MLAAGHPAVKNIKPRVKDLKDCWTQLLDNCREKKSRLQQAYQVKHVLAEHSATLNPHDPPSWDHLQVYCDGVSPFPDTLGPDDSSCGLSLGVL